jgi:hypothetical protein
MVDVEILGQVITHQYGTLNTGDVLRTSAEFAKHLVEDCGAAKYCQQAKADTAPEAAGDPVDPPPADPAPTRGRRTK